MRTALLLIISIWIFVAPGCKKDNDHSTPNCEALRTAMIANDVDAVKVQIENFINKLYSKAYTEENINKLLDLIANECGSATQLYCFDCIDTLPTQTEIGITFNMGSVGITRVVDLSYDGLGRIVFRYMHH